MNINIFIHQNIHDVHYKYKLMQVTFEKTVKATHYFFSTKKILFDIISIILKF